MPHIVHKKPGPKGLSNLRYRYTRLHIHLTLVDYRPLRVWISVRRSISTADADSEHQ